MDEFYISVTFDQEKYKRTGWTVIIKELDFDEFKSRLIVRVATGRKYWPLFTEVVNFSLGVNDPALLAIKASLKSYTFPMIDRFINELNFMLSDVYKTEINLWNIH